MKAGLTFIWTVVFVLPSTISQEKLELEGAIVIKDSELNMPLLGTIRFNTESYDFQGWNGLYWVSLTGGKQLGLYRMKTAMNIKL